MKDMPEKRLSAIGRLPSDIDGDEPRQKCHYCGRSDWESSISCTSVRHGFVISYRYLCKKCDDE